MAAPVPKKSRGGKKSPPVSGGPGIELEAGVLIIIFLLVVIPVVALFVRSVEDFAQNLFVARFILVLKVISGIVSVTAIGGIVYVVTQTSKMRAPLTSARESVFVSQEVKFHDEWEALRERFKVASDKDAALLIIEADALVDRALKYIGAQGETMGERMKFVSGPELETADDLWEAHKMRNQIAHGEGKDFLYVDALYAIDKFERVLKELNLL